MKAPLLAAVLLLACAACASAQPAAQTAPPVTPVAAAATSSLPTELSRPSDTSVNPADAPAGTYAIDGRHASVLFRIRHMGVGVFVARFDTIAGEINFNPQNVTASTVSATIGAASVSTGILNQQGERAFDREIANGPIGAAANPNITFVSRSIQATGPTTGLITGDLTLHGVTRPVVLEARFEGGRYIALRQKHVLAFTARTMIRRSDFQALWPVAMVNSMLSDDVEILIAAEAVKN